jgi:NitT/TauT family transport system ATP-binding protein
MNLSPEAAVPVLEARQVSHRFANQNGGLHVLESVSFSIQPGEFVALLGPSGCGKSTLLRLLSGLLAPAEGQILYRGSPILGPVPDTGIVFQKANLMPWRTVLDNILLPLQIRQVDSQHRQNTAQQMIELVGLGGFEKSLPRDLSGGMAQRVALARALISEPTLLFLDEPFGSLDALTREQMGLELLQIWQSHRITAILVTHSISEAILLADRVLVFSPRPGQIRLEMSVDLPRPRHNEVRYTPEFIQLARHLREAIAQPA